MTRTMTVAVALGLWVAIGLGLPALAPTLNGVKVAGLPMGYWIAAQGAPLMLAGLALWLAAPGRSGTAPGSWWQAACATDRWLSIPVVVGITSALVAQGHDGLALTLGVGGAAFLWATVMTQVDGDHAPGIAEWLADRTQSPVVGRCAKGVLALTAIALLTAGFMAVGGALVRLGVPLPVWVIVSVIAALVMATCQSSTNGSRLPQGALLFVCVLGCVIAVLVAVAGQDGAGVLVSVPALSDIAAFEQGLVQKRLADPALIKPYSVPFLRTDLTNFIATTVLLAFGLAVLGPAVQLRRTEQPGEGRTRGRIACIVLVILALLPPVAAVLKRALLSLTLGGVPVSTLPAWLQNDASAGLVSLCGGGMATLAKTCGNGFGPQGLLRWQDIGYQQDGLLTAGLDAGGLPPVGATAFAVLVLALGLLSLPHGTRLIALLCAGSTKSGDQRTTWWTAAVVVASIMVAGFLALAAVADSATWLVWAASLAAAGLAPAVAACLIQQRPSAAVTIAAIIVGTALTLALLMLARLSPFEAFAWSGSAAHAPPAVARKLASLLDTLTAVAEGPGRDAVRAQIEKLARDNLNWFGVKPAASGIFGLGLGAAIMLVGSVVRRGRQG